METLKVTKNEETMKKMTNEMRIFLTDYASYNDGSQFQFGHWVNLSDFSDADDLMEYIGDHFEECDEESPLDSPREEIMITDFEGFPESLYSESMNREDFEKVYELISFLEERGLQSIENEGDNLLDLWNEYCSEVNMDDYIYYFDDHTLEMLCGNDPMKAFQSGCFSEINWGDEYLRFDGYGNLESLDDPSRYIDETVLLDWVLDNL